MARLATLAVLLLSLLAVVSCRVLETISDDQGPPNSVLLAQVDQADAAAEVTPAVTVDEGVLRLPSHCRPCHLHRHLWWARHHGLSHHRGAFPGPGEARVHPAVDVVVPTELARGEEQEPREVELEAVAEPDPDSRPDSDAAEKLFHGEEEEDAANAWKVEMITRFRHGIRFHHRHHHEQDGEEHDDHEQEKDEGTSMNLFGRSHHRHHLRHHHDQDVEEDDHQQDKDEGPKMKLFRGFHHHHARDSDNEVDEVEELARKLNEAIMRRSFSHGGRRHHHHGAEGGLKNWFKGLINRF